MKLKMFSVYDSKVQAWLTPFFMAHVGQAMRSWEQASVDPQSNVSKYPADFTLFQIGEFDEITGKLEIYEVKQSLGTALEVQPKQDPLPMFPGLPGPTPTAISKAQVVR